MGKRRSRPTLEDVARRAKVSRATASMILARHEPHYSRHARGTIERVEQTAREIGYIPNMVAASLRSSRSPFVGVWFELEEVVPCAPVGQVPAFLWEVMKGIALALQEEDHFPVVLGSSEGASTPEQCNSVERMVRAGLGGLILAVGPERWKDPVARWQKAGIPCVSLFAAGGGTNPRCSVDVDNRAAGMMAWKHLSSRAHRDALCIALHPENRVMQERIAGFGQAARSAGVRPTVVPFQYDSRRPAHHEAENSETIIRAWRDSKATAVFVACGFAGEVVRRLIADGQGVGRDSDLVTMGLSPATDSEPPVSQIVYPGEQVGNHAAKLLIRRIRGEVKRTTNVLVPPHLVKF